MKALKKLIAFFLVLILSVVSGVVIYKREISDVSAALSDSKIIILDAGHGGFDGGAVANDGTVEKDINLSIAINIYEMLNTCGYDVILTRSDDTGTEDNQDASISQRKVSDLKNRLALINSYEDAIFVSVHLNKFTTSTANGAQVFYSKNHQDSRVLGQSIQDSVVSLIQPNNERVIKQATKSTYLLHNAKIPSVIVECGFLSNAAELKKLKDENYQKQMSFAICCGIINHLNQE